ncbi:TCD1, partial [Symbiodinium natans]
ALGSAAPLCPPPAAAPAALDEDEEARALLEEQLSRSSSFLGEEGHKKLCNSFVAIVGLGAVGSAAAMLLARAGVARLRLVDGSCISNSARHALARATDQGRPKVDVCEELMCEVLPHVDIELRREHLTAEQAPGLLGPSEDGRLPDMLLDCIGGTSGKELLMRPVDLALVGVDAVPQKGYS